MFFISVDKAKTGVMSGALIATVLGVVVAGPVIAGECEPGDKECQCEKNPDLEGCDEGSSWEEQEEQSGRAIEGGGFGAGSGSSTIGVIRIPQSESDPRTQTSVPIKGQFRKAEEAGSITSVLHPVEQPVEGTAGQVITPAVE